MLLIFLLKQIFKYCSKENVNVNIEDIIKTSPDADPQGLDESEYEEAEEVEEVPANSAAAWTYQQDEDDDIEIDYSGTPV